MRSQRGLVAAGATYRSDHWKFYVAPGIENGDDGKEELVRPGAEYAFEMNSRGSSVTVTGGTDLQGFLTSEIPARMRFRAVPEWSIVNGSTSRRRQDLRNLR